MARPYDFRAVTAGDLPLLYRWLETPHVARWWADGGEDPFAEEIPDGGDLRRWIVSAAQRDMAFVQDYRVHAWPDHPFSFLSPGARGIDMFIGPAEMIGQGHGTALVRQHARRILNEGAPEVAIDPHPDNIVAIRAYEKAGFRILGPPRDSDWGAFVPMVFTGGTE